MPNQSSSIAPVDIGNNTTITPEFSTNQLNDEFVFNYCRTTIINILRERIDVENDSRLFTLTLYMIQFIPDRTVRDIYTTTFLQECTNKQGKLLTNHKDSATTCVMATGVICDLFHAGNTSTNLVGCIVPDYKNENTTDEEEVKDE
ncbi:MAG: hypothetical protein M0R51_11960 [Clostridia bacterium]|jgi:hypothetical protein|nr:hypothetical protein [Clostridia bacterium]